MHKTRSVMIIGRTYTHVLQLFTVLVGKGLPVRMHGQTDTAKMFKTLLDDLMQTARNLSQVR